MYEELLENSDFDRIEKIAAHFVKIPSINSSTGEAIIANEIEVFLREIPYFTNHPKLVWHKNLQNDSLKRKNVFALLPKEGIAETVIFHAHIDTVGVDDFGALKDIAYNPKALKDFFSTYAEDPLIQSHAQSGDWEFGRGMLDMKSGLAVHLANLLYYLEHPEQQTVNILFMANCVEENDHTGIIESLPILSELKNNEKLKFIAAINTDFVSPLFENDETRYVYTGAAGKILPCIYIKGRETHVGSTLNGIDATLISSAINVAINTNDALCEQIDDEEITPSSCLFQRDQKDFYNVQTAKIAHLYFNTFLYEDSAKVVLNRFFNVITKTVNDVVNTLDNRLLRYQKKLNLPQVEMNHDMKVFLYEDYLNYLHSLGTDVYKEVAIFTEQHREMDKRKFGFELLNYLERISGDDQPKVIIFLAPPFCPHNYIKNTETVNLALEKAILEISNLTGENFKKRRFFPYLSDSSYLSMNESIADIEELTKNFPGMQQIYPLPVQAIQTLNIPAIDLGVFGIGAHTWKERIYKPYSYGVLPKLIRQTVLNLV